MHHYPSFEKFIKLAQRSPLVTVFRQLANDCLTPLGAFYNLDNGRNAFLLESVVGGEQIGRYSFLAVNPFLHFEAFRDKVRVTPVTGATHPDWSPEGYYQGPGDPLHALERLLTNYRAEHIGGIPRFCGGAVGYVTYDAVRYTEELPNAPPDDRGLPDLAFDFYDSLIIFDHLQKTLIVTAHAKVPEAIDVRANGTRQKELREAYEAACFRVDNLVERLKRQAPPPLGDIDLNPRVSRGFDKSNFDPKSFQDAVLQCKEYIAAGDIFQVVISQRFETETSASPFAVYRALRVLNPSPFMFYLRTGPTCLVGSSPEIMVRVANGEITVRPLAGTRRRGATSEEDARLAADLLADPKERAEHIMLVDLGRNDVGRVARYGTVQLTDIMTIERYSHVMHISSNVTGQLETGKTAFDALRACLPAGTVSGAPKVRAMQIIDQIEPQRRGPYAGAVGFIDFTGDLTTCLALRTMVFQTKKANLSANKNVNAEGQTDAISAESTRIVYIQTGAGIVADSVPEQEYMETINKAKALLKAIEVAEGWRFSMHNSQLDVLSCIQPTGEMHIGNYFGAVANWVALQESHRCIYGVVDLHSMTKPYKAATLRENTERMFVDLLACGIDPEKSILFIQSLVPEHAELCLILGCLCPYGELTRMTQFKEKKESAEKDGEFVSAGLFSYPVLQAADILIYRAKYVPVGKDQEQHLELSRVIARRFNEQFGAQFFPEPQPLFTESAKIMSLTDPTKKMSKSGGDGDYIGLFEGEKSIRSKIKSAVTDSGTSPLRAEMSPGLANLFTLLKACGKSEAATSLLKDYENGKRHYAELKAVVADALVELTSRVRARRQELQKNPAAVAELVHTMSAKARKIAKDTLREVRSLVGLPEGS